MTKHKEVLYVFFLLWTCVLGPFYVIDCLAFPNIGFCKPPTEENQ